MTACTGVRVEDPDIKNALSNRPPLAKMPEPAPSLMSADAPASVSFGCRVSSTDTSWHMTERRLAVTSFHCLTVGKSPLSRRGHGKLLPQVQWVGDGSGCYPHSIHSDLPER